MSELMNEWIRFSCFSWVNCISPPEEPVEWYTNCIGQLNANGCNSLTFSCFFICVCPFWHGFGPAWPASARNLSSIGLQCLPLLIPDRNTAVCIVHLFSGARLRISPQEALVKVPWSGIRHVGNERNRWGWAAFFSGPAVPCGGQTRWEIAQASWPN